MSYNEARMGRNSYKSRDIREARNSTVEMKVSELNETNEEIKRAKDDATQSWLDSKILVDELEKLQSNLAATKKRITESTAAISELESQLETTDKSIRTKREDELELRTTINEINQALDQTRVEMEQLKLEKDEERRARSELKQVLRLKKQTLRALQLTLRAVRSESEAFGSSAAEALGYINQSETDNMAVQLTQEEYRALKKRAKEETSLAEWRISVSTEQRFVAEGSRDLAFRRLKELHTDNKSRRRKTEDKIEGHIEDSSTGVGAQVHNGESAFPKARAKLMAASSQGKPRQKLRRSKNSNKILLEKKKTSIVVRIRTFLVRKIARLFG